MTCTTKNQTCAHCFCESSSLIRDLLLILSREVHKMIVFSADQEWNRRFIEASPLSIPLLNAIQRTLPRQIKHE